MLRTLFHHDVTPAGSEVIQRRVVRFKACRNVALDIASAEMNHDVHRGLGGELLNDRKVQMPRVERIKQCEMEATIVELRQDPVNGFVSSTGYRLEWRTPLTQTRVARGEEFRIRIGDEKVRKNAPLLLGNLPRGERPTVLKRVGMFYLDAAGPGEQVNVCALACEFLSGGPGRIDVSFDDPVFLLRHPAPHHHGRKSVERVRYHLFLVFHVFSPPCFCCRMRKTIPLQIPPASSLFVGHPRRVQ
ncbi:hypothetical protein FEP54_06047 [Burkholderia multivorans]|nr:hypothetical protein [Burkholderia multivorans]MDR8927289.1 hypothetical protein [Burkholderia multivorans]MDR8969562.1 hypothetical protein [Burkholderia multivorans]MDR9030579.1 hypothetical protein [Burkholderia multivorans]MDR9042613.1 hypothetical protein [Burkholderia multivorans]